MELSLRPHPTGARREVAAFAFLPLVLDPGDPAGADVMVVGAPLARATAFPSGISRSALRTDHKLCEGVRGYWPSAPHELEHPCARVMRALSMCRVQPSLRAPASRL